ncbi:hypothetical protein H4R35_002948 [Dimargaris xerosporica]|nr:hypothetical protein H4R35_002948 [Dimargaris xerosporica]
MPIITHEDFQERVQAGQAVILFDQKVYRLDSFMNRHPGGPLIIWHMIGRDATAEIRAMHPVWVLTKKLPPFCIGNYVGSPPDEGVAGLEPSDGGVQCRIPKLPNHLLPSHDSLPDFRDETTQTVNRQIAARDQVDPEALPIDYDAVARDFCALEQQLCELGLNKTPFYRYGQEAVRYALLAAGMLGLAFWGPEHWLTYTLSALCTAILWQQLALFAHDLGHNEFTQDLWWDGLIGVLLGNFCGGLSMGWWKKSHNIHHVVTNDPEHDPDIQHLPFFAVTTKFFRSLRSSYYGRRLHFDALAGLVIPLQHLLYIPVLCFGRFNLYFLSFNHLLTASFAPWRWLELVGMAVFWAWYGCFLACFPRWQYGLLYMLLSHMFSFILHLQITLSHFGMSTTCPDPENECFAARQLRTTMDIDCPEWFDWFHGGLQFQVEHHLFPRIPRHNLRQVQPLVRAVVNRHPGLQLYSFGFIEANRLMLISLRSVGQQVAGWLRLRLKTKESG